MTSQLQSLCVQRMFAIGRPDGTAPVREAGQRLEAAALSAWARVTWPVASRACVVRSQAASTAWAKVGVVADAAAMGGVVSACAAAAPTRAHHSTQPAEKCPPRPEKRKLTAFLTDQWRQATVRNAHQRLIAKTCRTKKHPRFLLEAGCYG